MLRRSRKIIRGLKERLSEYERFAVPDHVVAQLKGRGDPWRLNEEGNNLLTRASTARGSLFAATSPEAFFDCYHVSDDFAHQTVQFLLRNRSASSMSGSSRHLWGEPATLYFVRSRLRG